MGRKRYFSVDEEFSGLDHRKNCLLSIGMIEVEQDSEDNNKWKCNHSREFYLELKPSGEVNEESMKINGLNLKNLEEYGVTKENAVREINKYLDLQSGDTAVFIAYCGVLDKIFFDQVFQDVGKDSPFHYEIIEIGSLAMGKFGFEWGFTEQELLDKLELPELDPNEKHNALNDAVLQALEFCAIMNHPS